jgi:hypothetical protein
MRIRGRLRPRSCLCRFGLGPHDAGKVVLHDPRRRIKLWHENIVGVRVGDLGDERALRRRFALRIGHSGPFDLRIGHLCLDGGGWCRGWSCLMAFHGKAGRCAIINDTPKAEEGRVRSIKPLLLVLNKAIPVTSLKTRLSVLRIVYYCLALSQSSRRLGRFHSRHSGTSKSRLVLSSINWCPPGWFEQEILGSDPSVYLVICRRAGSPYMDQDLDILLTNKWHGERSGCPSLSNPALPPMLHGMLGKPK